MIFGVLLAVDIFFFVSRFEPGEVPGRPSLQAPPPVAQAPPPSKDVEAIRVSW